MLAAWSSSLDPNVARKTDSITTAKERNTQYPTISTDSAGKRHTGGAPAPPAIIAASGRSLENYKAKVAAAAVR